MKRESKYDFLRGILCSPLLVVSAQPGASAATDLRDGSQLVRQASDVAVDPDHHDPE
jgi:hypothetical protein